MKRLKSAGIIFWEEKFKSKLKNFLADDFFRNKIVIWLSIASFIVNVIEWIILWIYIKPVDFPIIIHYNVYRGVDLMDSWQQVFTLPLVGIILFIINFLLALYFYRAKERIASYLLLIAILMLQLSFLVASISVIIINY